MINPIRNKFISSMSYVVKEIKLNVDRAIENLDEDINAYADNIKKHSNNIRILILAHKHAEQMKKDGDLTAPADAIQDSYPYAEQIRWLDNKPRRKTFSKKDGDLTDPANAHWDALMSAIDALDDAVDLNDASWF